MFDDYQLLVLASGGVVDDPDVVSSLRQIAPLVIERLQ